MYLGMRGGGIGMIVIEWGSVDGDGVGGGNWVGLLEGEIRGGMLVEVFGHVGWRFLFVRLLG